MAYINGKKILDIVMTGLGLTFFSDKGKRAAGLFQGMNDLKKIPEGVNLLQPTSFENMFKDCKALEEAPELDTSQSTNFHGMFRNTKNLKKVSRYDTGCVPDPDKGETGTDFCDMFRGSVITEPPEFDTQYATNFYRMFASAGQLKALPEFNTINGKNFGYMFNYCQNMQNDKEITYNVGKAGNFSFMFNECRSMRVAPIMNTYNGRAFAYMFAGCTSLVTIPNLYLTNTVEQYYDENNTQTYACFFNTFAGCVNLENITIQGYINHNINFKDCAKLTHDSLMSIINALCHYSSSTTSHECELGSINLAKLTDEEKAIATNKNWYLS